MEMESRKTVLNGMCMVANKRSTGGCRGNQTGEECEIRPGGMLVQKRNSSEPNQKSVSVSLIKVRVKHGSSCQEFGVSAQASFGDLKKIVAEHTGLHPQDQKLVYKNKEKDSKEYLDVARVKDGSKIVLIEDVRGRERRCLEMLKSSRTEKVSKFLEQVSLEIDNLGEKVRALELTDCGDRKVVEGDLDNLDEILMTKLVKLDGISIQGDLNLQKRAQEKRIQKMIKALDLLKLNNSKTSVAKNKCEEELESWKEKAVRQTSVTKQKLPVEPIKEAQVNNRGQVGAVMKQQPPLTQSEYSVVMTTDWETFD